jgi:hypothetical protein
MMFWVLDYFLLSSIFSFTSINTPSFFTPHVPIKLNSLHPHSYIHEPYRHRTTTCRTSSAGLLLALSPRKHQPLLPSVSCLAWALSSLPTGGELPSQGSSTWVARSASGRAPHWICRPSCPPWRWRRWRVTLPGQSPSKPPWRWHRWCDMARRWRGCN